MRLPANHNLILGSLIAVFLGTRLLAQHATFLNTLQAQISEPASVSSKMSPISKVTFLVSPKSLVTNQSVTMSPIVSPSPTPEIKVNETNIIQTVSPSLAVTPLSTPAATSSPLMTPVSNPVAVNSNTSVVINEIAWMGTAASANDEWIELYNSADHPISLDGWTLASRDGSPSIALSGPIGAGAYYVLKRTPNDVLPDVPTGKMYSGALGNSGEYLEHKDASGMPQDAVDGSGGWPAGENPSGNPQDRASMERVNPAVAGTNPANWKTNTKAIRNGHDSAGNPVNGTPGNANSVRSI